MPSAIHDLPAKNADNVGKVLLTGGTGFVASHVLDSLLEQGYSVVVTVRSEAKGKKILDAFPKLLRERLSFAVVEDIAKKGAFDEAVKTDPPLDFVIHTASPYHFNIKDAAKEFYEPAINGTTEILKAITAFAPQVKRVVLTMSFANMVNPVKHPDVYDETCWSFVKEGEELKPQNAYRGSKIMAEKAAWDYVEKYKPHFDIVTIHPPMVYGPVSRFLDNLDGMNTSNERIKAIIQGDIKEKGLPPTIVYIFVDVRDAALAHVRALQVDEAGGQRFLVTGGHYSNKKIAEIIRETYPELVAKKLPPAAELKDDTPADVYGYDNKKSREILKLNYRTIDECIRDAAASMIALGAGNN